MTGRSRHETTYTKEESRHGRSATAQNGYAATLAPQRVGRWCSAIPAECLWRWAGDTDTGFGCRDCASGSGDTDRRPGGRIGPDRSAGNEDHDRHGTQARPSLLRGLSQGGEQKAQELGVTFEYVAPQQADPALQVKIIEDLIAKKVHAISISPNEPKSVEPVIAEGMKQGILMMTFDSDSPNSQRVMYIGTDNKAAGKTMGETMAKLLNGQGKVGIITGGLGALNLNQRIEGFKEGVGPNIQVVDVQATDDDLQKGLSVSEAMLRAHPDLNGIACVSATGGPTLAQVLKSPEFQDRIGKLVIVAFDDLEETKRAIQEGIIAATMVQRPVQMGVLTVQWAYDILTGKAKPPFQNIDTGVTVVTKENLNSYTK